MGSKMNKCFNDLPQYKNRRYVASYSRRTRSRSKLELFIERLLMICEAIVEGFETSTARVVLKIGMLSVMFAAFFVFVAAIEAGSIGLLGAAVISPALVLGFAAALRL